MRIVQVATALVATLALVSCEPVTEPTTDLSVEPPIPSFAVLNPVVEEVTGSASFEWTQPSTGEMYWRTFSMTARKHADGSVNGTFQANYHGAWKDKGRISCFTIIGNEAWLGVVIESSTMPHRVGAERIIYAQENGEGSKADPDRSTGLISLSSTGLGTLDEYCEAMPTIQASSVHDVEAGNIRIHSLNPVVEQVTGSAGFHRTDPRGLTYWHTGAFNARRYADGSVNGMYHGNGGPAGPYRGRVHCFTVVGNEAWLGVIVERSQNSSIPPFPGQSRAVYVQDNGEGAGAPPDRSTAFPPLGITGLPDLDTYCAETPEMRPQSVFDLEAGNVQILP